VLALILGAAATHRGEAVELVKAVFLYCSADWSVTKCQVQTRFCPPFAMLSTLSTNNIGATTFGGTDKEECPDVVLYYQELPRNKMNF